MGDIFEDMFGRRLCAACGLAHCEREGLDGAEHTCACLRCAGVDRFEELFVARELRRIDEAQAVVSREMPGWVVVGPWTPED